MNIARETWNRACQLSVREIRETLDPLDQLASFEYNNQYQSLLAQNILDSGKPALELTLRELLRLVDTSSEQCNAIWNDIRCQSEKSRDENHPS